MRAELGAVYAAADRHYHGLAHIEALLRLADVHAMTIGDHDAVEAAIWFHDAVYDTRRSDNEEKSAQLAAGRLAGIAAPDRLARIAAMIRATANHAVPDFGEGTPESATQDCALFLDFDLAVLGSPAAEFANYEAAVRREYAWASERLWIAGRRAVLEHFLARPAIYATAQFRASHEAAARRNLRGASAIRALSGPPSFVSQPAAALSALIFRM